MFKYNTLFYPFPVTVYAPIMIIFYIIIIQTTYIFEINDGIKFVHWNVWTRQAEQGSGHGQISCRRCLQKKKQIQS